MTKPKTTTAAKPKPAPKPKPGPKEPVPPQPPPNPPAPPPQPTVPAQSLPSGPVDWSKVSVTNHVAKITSRQRVEGNPFVILRMPSEKGSQGYIYTLWLGSRLLVKTDSVEVCKQVAIWVFQRVILLSEVGVQQGDPA